ncbi:MAG: DUF2851 family protein [Sphingobacteriales bacterium]|nr:MAG: DUF2851 family protein [Sphingobacteriales bacterium]
MEISENFLFFVWRYRLLNNANHICVGGEVLEVIYPGLLNTNAGPDFTEARLIIDGRTWAGNIEIHTKSSDWQLHRHQIDNAYESVILHVVYENDLAIENKSGQAIPTLILKGLFPELLFENYVKMLSGKESFPCRPQIKTLEPIVVNTFLSRLVVERLEQKTLEVFAKLKDLKGNWYDTFYFFLARNFGFKVNALPFELLANVLPLQLLNKHSDSAVQVEAMVFGQAGFLENIEVDDEHAQLLKAEYKFLKLKYNLKPIEVSVWKFLRMRPASFPTIRLAQFAALHAQSNQLFAKILRTQDLKAIGKLFTDLPISPYWHTHYHFKKSTTEMQVQLGKKSIENILINTVCVFLFAYGKYTAQGHLIDRALDFLEKIPAERNTIVNQYVDAGLKIDTAFASQSILQLNKYYCTQKKCLNCGIGIKILRR